MLIFTAFVSFTYSAIALTEAKWTAAEVQLSAPKARILELLGKPDSIDTGTEIYLISDSKDLMMGMVEYKDDKVNVLGQIHKPSVTLDSLKEKIKATGITPLTDTPESVVYFTKMPTGDLEYYMVLNPSGDPTLGPSLSKMTKETFTEAGPDELASPTEKTEEKKEEKK